MKKFFTLIAGVMLAASASATTPYKNLYAEASVYPSGSGLVYLAAKNDAEQSYVYEQSEDYGETAMIKITCGENGSNYNEQDDCQGTGSGLYDVRLIVMPEDGYEFVCAANVVLENAEAVYTKDECYITREGTGVVDFQWGWDLWNDADKLAEQGCLININSLNHPEDSNSDNGTQMDCFTNQPWPETPDTYIYAIMRKVGAEYPKLVLDEANGVEKVVMSADENAPVYNVAGQKVSVDAKGIVVKNGKKFVK